MMDMNQPTENIPGGMKIKFSRNIDKLFPKICFIFQAALTILMLQSKI